MNFIPFQSRDSFFKSIFGSIPNCTDLHLRILMPRSFNCNGAFFMLKKDGEDFTEHQMFWAGMNGEDEEVWDITVSVDDPGLYWYHFEYSSPFGRSSIMQSYAGLGAFWGRANYCKEWQLTVYDRKFKTPDWLKGGLIYQIFPDRFYDSGTAKDNVPKDRVLRKDWDEEPKWKPNRKGKVLNNDYFGGDLEGIREKLPYLKSLGVNCIYLNPIFEAHSNHRYNTADYSKIDPLLGNEDDFKKLCQSAKKAGIHIVLDGVFSHTGDDSKYFNKEGRYDSIGAYNSEKSPYYDWYKFSEWPDDYKSWWGFETLPEVEEENPSYRQFICGKDGIIASWLKAGADGFRLDVADELPDIFIDELHTVLKKTKKDAVLIGEVWEDASNKHSYGHRRRYLLGDQFDSVMNYPFANAVLDFCRAGEAPAFMSSVMDIMENYPKVCLDVMMNHIGTHDTERAITRIVGESCEYKDREWQSSHPLTDSEYKKGVKLLKMAAAIQYMLPGVPSLYYGDEAGMQGYKDPFNRACYPWGKENKDLLDFYKKLGKFRRGHALFREGGFKPVSYVLGCIAFARYDKDDCALIIANRNEHEIRYTLPEEYHGYKAVFGNNPENGDVIIDGMSFVILIKKS
ncbi:MAG: glycoside hydrolase family 13 protein [Clostridiales bacterium]|nr:glycoside hydrolase family 13 protein [Clostridiales bacterium]